MSLLGLLVVGLLALSGIELRKGSAGKARALAQANARPALQQVIAQLQREPGPDQRVSAAADLAGLETDLHLAGVWASIDQQGNSWWRRDEETGSWLVGLVINFP